jgi:hypothetical protein
MMSALIVGGLTMTFIDVRGRLRRLREMVAEEPRGAGLIGSEPWRARRDASHDIQQ